TVIASPGAYQNAFLTVFPTGGAQPTVSTLNFDGGELAANAAVVPAGTGGSIDVFVNAAAHLIVDVNGYYVPLSSQTGSVVTSLAGGTGALTLAGTNGITASRVGQAITVTSNATSNATASTIASRDANGLLKSNGLDLGLLQASSNLVFANGTRFLHRTGGSIFLGLNAGNLTTSCLTCIAIGDNALQSVASNSSQVAIGRNALKSLATDGGNTAIGDSAIDDMTAGATNVGVGLNVLGNATGGNFNTAVGGAALFNLTSGNDNVAIGNLAGTNVTSGSNNIYIGRSVGLASSGSESNTIRIGKSTHTATFLAGISGQTSASGVAVLVNSSGKLGTTFLYREDLDPDRVRQYGLIAEEVAEVAPDLVVLGVDGTPQTVRYHLLVPLLLDALQKQQRLAEAQGEEIAEQRRRADALQRELGELRGELRATRPALSPR
ncbi:MAG: hypothetical protein DYH06_22955, partial [Acidobacteria bacterium ACB2]|nr:hypothetical protein [Acidobacteria bacterium ACB2]